MEFQVSQFSTVPIECLRLLSTPREKSSKFNAYHNAWHQRVLHVPRWCCAKGDFHCLKIPSSGFGFVARNVHNIHDKEFVAVLARALLNKPPNLWWLCCFMFPATKATNHLCSHLVYITWSISFCCHALNNIFLNRFYIPYLIRPFRQSWTVLLNNNKSCLALFSK